MPHQQMAFYLLQRIQYNTHKDDQRSTAKEPRKHLADTNGNSDWWNDSDDGQEYRTRQVDLRNDTVDELGSGSARLHARYKTAILLHIVGHLVGINGDGRIEVGEYNN